MPDYDTTSLANGVSRGIDNYERTYANGKIADQIVKVNPEMLQMLGMSQEQFGGMSAQDRTSAVSGVITGMGIKAQQQQQRMNQMKLLAQQQDMQAQADERQTVADSRKALEGFANDYSSGPPQQPATAPGMPPAPTSYGSGPTEQMLQKLASLPNAPVTTPDRVAYALQRNPGAFAARDFSRNAAALEALGNTTPGQLNFQEDPVTGTRFASLGKQVLNSGINPAKQVPITPEELHDEQGNPTGIFAVRNGGKLMLRTKPAVNPAQQEKLNVDSLVEAEKATQQLDQRITRWNTKQNAWKADPKNNTAPDPAELQDLQARRARLQGALNGVGAPANSTIPKYSSPEEIRDAYKAGKLTNAQAQQALKDQFNFK